VLPYIKDVSFNNVTAVILDERFDQTNENNNFSQIENLSWSSYFLENGGTFISTKVLDTDTQKSLAERFEMQIEKWITKNPNGRVIALFGMGNDGHTAGIFPYPENKVFFDEMFDGERIIASYDADTKNKFSKRITTTNALFKRIDLGFAYIFGNDKKAALDDFRSGIKEVSELPVMFLKNIKKIKIVTDIE
jgi:6-phosphogluconolactonase/glucosamine-6-phosphate isomerase/deaminase